MKKRGKTFLSESHQEFGSVAWFVTTEEDWGDDVQGRIRITDCYKQIELDLDCDIGKVHKRIEKVDTLIEELMAVRSALQEAKDAATIRRRPY